MARETEALAAFAAGLQWSDIPTAVQRHARLVVLDTVGVMLAGSERPEVRALRARLAADAPGSATMLATGWPTSDPRSAALVNGIAARSHTRTGRQRCSVQSSPHRDCAASMPPPSGWRCASARR